MSLPVTLSLRSGKGTPCHTPAIPKIPGDINFIAVKWSQNVVNLEIFHKILMLNTVGWKCLKEMISLNGLKETYCKNYIVLIEKYIEIIRFDWLVVETSKRRILCNRIQWVQPKIISYNTCWHLRCPISVTNGVFSTPHGPLILIKLMSICNLTPLISVCWQQLSDVMLWTLTWIFSLYQIWYAKIF